MIPELSIRLQLSIITRILPNHDDVTRKDIIGPFWGEFNVTHAITFLALLIKLINTNAHSNTFEIDDDIEIDK